MFKKVTIALTLVLLGSLILGVFAVAAAEDVVGLTIVNRTDGPVYLSLTNDTANYWLAAKAGEEQYFTVKKGDYDRTTYACGQWDTGTVRVRTLLKLIFTRCAGAPNAGEASMEKVNYPDWPGRSDFYYK